MTGAHRKTSSLRVWRGAAVFAVAGWLSFGSPALAWNEEGHKIVALVALHYLDPAAKQKIDAMLAAGSR